MQLSPVFFAMVVATAVSACASVPPFQAVPAGAPVDTYSVVRSSLLDETGMSQGHLDDAKNVLYFQNFGGTGMGGVAIGAILGPVGLIANMAISSSMIGSKTEKEIDAFRGKLGLDPIELFRRAAESQAMAASDDSSGARITPYVYVSKADPEKFYATASVLVGHEREEGAWTGKYMYQIDRVISPSELAEGLGESERQQLADAIERGFGAVLRMYLDDAKGAFGEGRPIVFRSSLATPRFSVPLRGEELMRSPDRVVIRTVGVMFSLPTSQVTVDDL